MNRCTLGSAIFVLLAAGPAQAQGVGRDPAAADALFQEGRAEAVAGHYDRACPKFDESYRLDPAVGTLLNRADCAEHLGRPAEALARFTQALGELPAGDSRSSYVRERIGRVKPRVPRLKIVVVGNGPVTILRDRVEVEPSTLNAPWLLEPGRHVIVVRAPGRVDREITVDLTEGTEQQVRAEPGEPLQGGVGPTRSSAVPADLSTRAETRYARPRPSVLPWIVGGVGAVGVVVGSAAGIVAISDASTVKGLCPSKTCPTPNDHDAASRTASEGMTMETLSTVALGVGLAGLAAAAYLWIAAPSSAPARAGAWVAPWGGPSAAGLAAGARFE